ncbi:hypothetical protein ASE73_02615 [Sphingomonas sp. Leaf24]|uniref:hypothetical protein n=1 Tax=unclassified Sphingomonas TaxID=196159 RepID=UPI0006F203AB|nr:MULTISPECIES: hypothetical protein [unclassified Sphingomonas]KQM23136.1 hypothetical protein ASE50_02615 [Sphingomonas sp. Leaf5]KQM95994.1 hypothetical protein ASE73_02615 [Sphingomonas sp. Leaf24]
METTETVRPAFGGWLTSRSPQGDWIDDLVAVAANDRSFPRRGDPETVRHYLGGRGATGDMFERLDDAELEWLGY